MDGTETPLEDVLSEARSPQLWGGRQLVVVWQAERYKLENLQPLEKYIQAPARQTCLVLIAVGLKQKDVQAHTLWRQLLAQDAALGFSRLRESELAGWLEQEAKQQGKMLGAGAARKMVEAVGQNLSGIISGTGKSYSLYRRRKNHHARLILKNSAATAAPTQFLSWWKLWARASRIRPSRFWDRLLELGEHPSKIIVMLARQIRLLMRTREGLKSNLDAAELAKELGVPKFVAEKLQRQASGFRLAQLKGQLIRLHEADQQIKTGMAVPRLLLEKVILDLCPLPALKLQPKEH